MMYYEVLEKRKINDIYEINIANFKAKPKAGQFVSLIIPNETEVPLGVGDYDENSSILKLYIESENLVKKIGKRVIIKGPLGRPLDFTGAKSVLGVSNKKLFHDISYPLKIASKNGIKVSTTLIEYGQEMNKFEADMIIVSLPLNEIKKYNFPERKTFIYNRWVKMNCMLGVCGICEIKGKLACIQGPFMRLDEIVD